MSSSADAARSGSREGKAAAKSNRTSGAGPRAIASVLATNAQDTRSKKMAWEAGLKAKGSPEDTPVGNPEPKMQAENPTAIHGVSDGDQKGRIKGGIGNMKSGGKHSTPLQTQMTQRNTETTVPDSTRMTGDQGAVDQSFGDSRCSYFLIFRISY